jgi:hypothetical protein
MGGPDTDTHTLLLSHALMGWQDQGGPPGISMAKAGDVKTTKSIKGFGLKNAHPLEQVLVKDGIRLARTC